MQMPSLRIFALLFLCSFSSAFAEEGAVMSCELLQQGAGKAIVLAGPVDLHFTDLPTDAASNHAEIPFAYGGKQYWVKIRAGYGGSQPLPKKEASYRFQYQIEVTEEYQIQVSDDEYTGASKSLSFNETSASAPFGFMAHKIYLSGAKPPKDELSFNCNPKTSKKH
jgi:hypothetical protein